MSVLHPGREYDKDGVLKSWWEADVITRFNETAQCFVKQYSKYTSNGEHVCVHAFLIVFVSYYKHLFGVLRCMEAKRGLYKKKIFGDLKHLKYGYGGE